MVIHIGGIIIMEGNDFFYGYVHNHWLFINFAHSKKHQGNIQMI